MNVSALGARATRRATALLIAGGLIAFLLTFVSASTPAQAAPVDVATSCATVDVRLGAHPDKAEVQVVIDGEYQTDGATSGWYLFRSSFSGRYAFEPDVAHTYVVSVNSFAADSDGKAFTPGVGGDTRYTGETTPCAALQVTAAASSCVSDSRVDKQQISLEISKLRRSVTYLTEVLDESGAVVTHFQFRTSPVVSKTFSGLTAGETYLVRVTDQSNDVLSGATTVEIAGCAADMDLDAVTAGCVGASADVTAHLAGLVPGRAYTATLAPGSAQVAIDGDDADGTLRFSGLDAETSYTVRVEDDNAPRTVRATITTPACADGGSGSGDGTGSGSSAGSGSEDGTGSGSGSGAVGATGSGSAGGAGSTGDSGTAGTAAGSDGAPSATFTPTIVSAGAASATTAGYSETAAAGTADAAADAAGPGDEPGAYAASGTAAGDAGPSATAASASAPVQVWVIATLVALLAVVLVLLLWLRRRAS